ncbi:proteasome subunit alpha [Micromonospora rifamycinica]|uniref:Proteasome subunit alpha n=1 Tax=Micromonospora rifamycinica TaxID=291594 RepID=A0A109IM00_9ACTN|nr:proteasome subunit alpha [Micromonospora rifamycinica]KWV32968.1 proteasome subunit alpha [Micromonospora rifamycinica]SCG38854.1 proteasome alpha subunit [Micromonospora rifamycinica]
MAMQFYASPEQIMRDRSELARKGIARGRSAVVLSYTGGVLFVAENLSSALHKVSEIYDRIGFAAVGRYNEFENLRRAGVRMADLNGLSYDRRDVTGRALANAFAQTLGAIFTEQSKPFEVEICVAQVGATADEDELYRLTYDGSVNDEPGRMAMGGQAEAITGVLKSEHRADMSLSEAVTVARKALSSVGGEGGAARTIAPNQLEVAVLDRNRVGRTFRRITGAALTALLEGDAAGDVAPAGGRAETPSVPTEEAHKPTTSAGSADLEGQPQEKPEA